MAWSLTNPKAVCRREKRTRCGGGRADPTPGTRGPHWERADPMALGFGNQTGRTSRVLTTSGAEHLKLQTSGSALGRGTEPQRSGRRLEGCPRTSEPVPGGRGSLGDPSENERAGRCHLPPAHPQPRHAETRRSSAALRTCTRHPPAQPLQGFLGQLRCPSHSGPAGTGHLTPAHLLRPRPLRHGPVPQELSLCTGVLLAVDLHAPRGLLEPRPCVLRRI